MHATEAAPQEPRYTIHTEDWAEGRRRIGRIADAREREAYAALFDHLERGWRILAPLAVRAEALAYSRPSSVPAPDLHQDMAGFVHVLLTEEYRGIAFECLTLIPEPSGRVADPRAVDPVTDMDVMLRCLRGRAGRGASRIPRAVPDHAGRVARAGRVERGFREAVPPRRAAGVRRAPGLSSPPAPAGGGVMISKSRLPNLMWEEDRACVERMRPSKLRTAMLELYAYVEEGWKPVVKLRTLVGADEWRERLAGVEDPTGALIHFLDMEIIERWREMATDSVRFFKRAHDALLLDQPPWDDVESEGECVSRYLRVAERAAAAPDIAPALREAVLEAVEQVTAWMAGYWHRCATMEKEIDAALARQNRRLKREGKGAA
jgi:hypothetical protein